jgi:hypothetical protein
MLIFLSLQTVVVSNPLRTAYGATTRYSPRNRGRLPDVQTHLVYFLTHPTKDGMGDVQEELSLSSGSVVSK